MNAYKSLISFALLLVAIKRGNSLYTPLDEKAKCENAKLVQYTNYFVCACNEGKVHDSDLKCVDAITAACTKAGDTCGEYAKCVAEGVEPSQTFKCQCITGYETVEIAPSKNTCVPKGCKAIGSTCGSGICAKKTDSDAQCACFIGNSLDSNTQKCVVDEKLAECKLTCTGENFGCVVNNKQFYDCGCKEGYELKEGKCVEIPVVDKYVPLNEKSVCENAVLTQYTNYYACKCEDGKVHSSDLKCVEPITGQCTENGKICGDYASCVTEADVKVCKCNEGYIYNDAKPAVCVPLGCDKKDVCKDGSCVKQDDLTSKCACNIGKTLDATKLQCVDASENAECKLTCTGDNRGCIIENSEYYKCGCKEGYELKEGKCVEAPKKDPSSAFPASGILNVGLLFLASSMVYILV